MSKYYHKKEFYKKREWGEIKGYNSSDPILLEVVLEENDTVERLIKRFLKKFKKSRLMDEFREHEAFLKPSLKRREKEKRGRAKARKLEEERNRKEEY